MIKEMFDEVNVGPVERVLSVAAGAAALTYAVRHPRKWGGMTFVLAGNLLWRGITGRSPLYRAMGVRRAGQARDAQKGIKVSRSILVQRPPEELYAFWRNFENLPRVMRHVEAVQTLEGNRSHWKVRGPAGTTLEWDAELVQDIPNELITWQTLEGAGVVHAGSVSFQAAPDHSTEVKVILRYDPPGGAVGAAMAGVLGEDPSIQVEQDLQEFKKMAEAGDLPAYVRTGAAG